METKTIKKTRGPKNASHVYRDRESKLIRDLWDLPKLAIKTGDKHLSQRIDEIVYGE